MIKHDDNDDENDDNDDDDDDDDDIDDDNDYVGVGAGTHQVERVDEGRVDNDDKTNDNDDDDDDDDIDDDNDYVGVGAGTHQVERVDEGRVVALVAEDLAQVRDVGGRQAQRVQLGQLRVRRHPRQRRLQLGDTATSGFYIFYTHAFQHFKFQKLTSYQNRISNLKK